MRVALLLGWVVILLALVLPMLRRRSLAGASAGRGAAGPALRDELVKDPVCQTYIARSRAVRVAGVEGPRYFCSAECARRFAPR